MWFAKEKEKTLFIDRSDTNRSLFLFFLGGEQKRKATF